MDITFSDLSLPTSGAVVLGVTEAVTLSTTAKDIDGKTNGALTRAIKSQKFKGKHGSTITILSPSGIEADAVILVGLGKAEELTETELQHAGGAVFKALDAAKISEASIAVDTIEGASIPAQTAAAQLAYGVLLRSYRFDKYRTKEDDDDQPTGIASLNVMVDNMADASAQFDVLKNIASGVFLTRDVVTEPPNHLHPESYAARIKEELTAVGAKVEVLGEEKLTQLGMGALLGVGQASIRESHVVVIHWEGDPKGKEAQPIAFVGKGVTFDTGGISLKPSGGMEDMKYDMGGSGVVVGLMKALAARKAKVNAVGIVGLVENMPGGNAQRPSDVVTSMSGQTIEVLNTDAEGRLVLADALWYCQDRFKPKFMIDLATLTGAIVIALADQYAGLFSNNDELSQKLSEMGEKTKEKVWRFPLTEEYDEMLKSKIADMQNISDGRGAGSITAAQFLQRFVNDTPWAHIDIAGMAWNKKGTPIAPEGATAFGVRLLNQLVADYYE